MVREPRTRRRAGRGFWREWRWELIALAAAALGVFLLTEQLNIRATIGGWFLDGYHWVVAALGALLEVVERIHPSDLAGLLLLVVAVTVILRRVGYRMQLSAHLSAAACPRCGRATLRRVHRRGGDIVTWVLPLRRYECRDESCAWTGLRARPLHRHRREVGADL